MQHYTMQDKTPHNEKKQPHGYWVVHHDNHNLWFKGHYVNDVEYGYFEHWSYFNSSGIIEYYAR
jgi:hypothetical protein